MTRHLPSPWTLILASFASFALQIASCTASKSAKTPFLQEARGGKRKLQHGWGGIAGFVAGPPTEEPTHGFDFFWGGGEEIAAPVSSSPSKKPTPRPTSKRYITLDPTRKPTPYPTSRPTPSPSNSLSWSPSMKPTWSPSWSPSWSPTTKSPTRNPTRRPTNRPTNAPSGKPVNSLFIPSGTGWGSGIGELIETRSPTRHPTERPSNVMISSGWGGSVSNYDTEVGAGSGYSDSGEVQNQEGVDWAADQNGQIQVVVEIGDGGDNITVDVGSNNWDEGGAPVIGDGSYDTYQTETSSSFFDYQGTSSTQGSFFDYQGTSSTQGSFFEYQGTSSTQESFYSETSSTQEFQFGTSTNTYNESAAITTVGDPKEDNSSDDMMEIVGRNSTEEDSMTTASHEGGSTNLFEYDYQADDMMYQDDAYYSDSMSTDFNGMSMDFNDMSMDTGLDGHLGVLTRICDAFQNNEVYTTDEPLVIGYTYEVAVDRDFSAVDIVQNLDKQVEQLVGKEMLGCNSNGDGRSLEQSLDVQGIEGQPDILTDVACTYFTAEDGTLPTNAHCHVIHGLLTLYVNTTDIRSIRKQVNTLLEDSMNSDPNEFVDSIQGLEGIHYDYEGAPAGNSVSSIRSTGNEEESETLSTIWIAGIAMISAGTIAVVALAVFCLRRKKKANAPESFQKFNDDQSADSTHDDTTETRDFFVDINIRSDEDSLGNILGNEAMIGNDLPSAKAGDIPNYMKNDKL